MSNLAMHGPLILSDANEIKIESKGRTQEDSLRGQHNRNINHEKHIKPRTRETVLTEWTNLYCAWNENEGINLSIENLSLIHI